MLKPLEKTKSKKKKTKTDFTGTEISSGILSRVVPSSIQHIFFTSACYVPSAESVRVALICLRTFWWFMKNLNLTFHGSSAGQAQKV